MISEEDITIYDSSIGMTNGKEFKLEITRLDVNELIDIRNDILSNQKIVERLKEFVNQSDFESLDEAIDYLHILPKLKLILENKT